MPEPATDINKFISENLVYPASAQAANIEGKVVVKFVVNEDGSITNATVVKPVNPALDSAAVKVFSNMPYWKPGKQAGQAVKVYYTMPIVFKLEDRPVNANEFEEIYTSVDHMPLPTVNIDEFFQRNMMYPSDAKKNHIQGVVNVIYIVNKDGTVSNAFIEKSLCGALDSEAIRLAKILPYFVPGHEGEKAVRVYYKAAVTFDIKADSLQKSLNSVFTNVEEIPSPTFNIKKYLALNMNYPLTDLIKKTEGVVMVGFIVNEDGGISNVTKLMSVGTQLMNTEAMRLVQEMPHWNPGKINGKAVKVYYMLPVVFSLKRRQEQFHPIKKLEMKY